MIASSIGNRDAEISDALAAMIRAVVRNYTIFEGTVVANHIEDEGIYTCDVQVGGPNGSVVFSDVALETVTDSAASVTFIPVVGSTVLMTFRDGHQDRPQLFKIDQVDTILIAPKTVTQFNGGKNGGMVFLLPLVDHLNTIEKNLNDLRAAMSAWEPVSGDGGAALKAAISNWLGEQIIPTERTDLENTTITQ